MSKTPRFLLRCNIHGRLIAWPATLHERLVGGGTIDCPFFAPTLPSTTTYPGNACLNHILALVADWESLKNLLVPKDQVIRAVIHIHGGMLLFLFLAFVSRRGIANGWALALLWVVALGTEGADIISMWPIDRPWKLRDTGYDLFNTLLWPTVLYIGASRFARRNAGETVMDEDMGEGREEPVAPEAIENRE
ncbi:hypothetical protein [Novosphingobium lindaniclasticum]